MKTDEIKVASQLAETVTLIRCYLWATGPTAPDLKLTDIQYSVYNLNNIRSFRIFHGDNTEETNTRIS
jgi:Trm5-related predicted tRNA methylase